MYFWVTGTNGIGCGERKEKERVAVDSPGGMAKGNTTVCMDPVPVSFLRFGECRGFTFKFCFDPPVVSVSLR